MDPDLRKLSDHMLSFSTGLLGHALWHVIMTGRGAVPWGEAFGVVHATHGGELLLKAAIAREHLLLIFNKTPKTPSPLVSDDPLLSFEALIRDGRTAMYSELPDLLWAATGYRLPDPDAYKAMGELRNAVQHFAVPNVDYRKRVLEYLCYVADPILQHFWSTEVFRAIVDSWDEQDDYLFFEEPVVKDALEESGVAYGGWVPTPDDV